MGFASRPRPLTSGLFWNVPHRLFTLCSTKAIIYATAFPFCACAALVSPFAVLPDAAERFKPRCVSFHELSICSIHFYTVMTYLLVNKCDSCTCCASPQSLHRQVDWDFRLLHAFSVIFSFKLFTFLCRTCSGSLLFLNIFV